MTQPFPAYASPLTLFSGSAGTGSAMTMAVNFDQALLVQISGSAASLSVTLLATSNGPTSSAFPIAAAALVSSSDTRQSTLTSTGLYYYPYVGGTTLFAQVSSSAGSLLVTGTPLKK